MKKLLNPDAAQRITSMQVLAHPWIATVNVPRMLPTLDLDIIHKLRLFPTVDKPRRICLLEIARTANVPNLSTLVEAFLYLDPTHSGALTVEGLQKVLPSCTETELHGKKHTEQK